MNEYQRRRVSERTAEVCAYFTKEYLKGYMEALVAKIKREKTAKPEPKWRLYDHPVDTEPLYEGWMTKQGGAVKNWKRRWFTVYPDYNIEYFEKKGGKKKGDCNLDGYEVIAEDLKDKPHSLECRHPKRRCWFFVCDSEEDKQKWLDVLRKCCQKATRATNKDPVMAFAFERAYRRTRWYCWLWGWYHSSGGEGERLGDLVCDDLEREILREIWSSLSGPTADITRRAVRKAVDSIVGTAVEAAWKKICQQIDENKEKFEEQVRKGIEPVIEKELELREKIKEKIMSTVDPVVQQIVVPPLAKVIEVLLRPIRAGYGELLTSYAAMAKKFRETVTKDGAAGLNSFRRSMYWSVRYHYGGICDKVWEHLRLLREPLEQLGEIVRSIRYWRVRDQVEDDMQWLMDRAAYTLTAKFEKKVEQMGTAEAMEHAVKKVGAKLLADSQRQIIEEYTSILLAVVQPPFSEDIIPKITSLIEPLDDLIPEPIKILISPQKACDDLLNEVVVETVKRAVEGAAKEDPELLTEAFGKLSL